MSPAKIKVRDILAAFGTHYDPSAPSHVRKMREAVAVFLGKDEPQPVAPGGGMPEPFPGMGIKWINARGEQCLDVCAPRIDPENGSWYAWIGDDTTIHQPEIRAIYDGRREIWRRA